VSRFQFSRKTWSYFGVASAGIVAGIIFWGGFNTAMEATNSMEFCTSCHEMRDTVFQEYKKSIHYSNPAGVRAICSDCHVPKDWTHKIVRKVQASGELWGKLTGSIDTPEKFEAKRLDLAKHEWARMKATDSRECRNCHSFEAMDFGHQKPKGSKIMQKAMNEGGTCIDCHKGIAHKLPDMSSGYRKLLSDLKSAASGRSGSAKALWAIESTEFYSARPDGATGKGDGTVFPMTQVKVLERDGDFVKVEVHGWIQEGVKRLMVTAMGRRIFEVSMSEKVAGAVELGEARVDPDTTISWKEGKVSGWVRTAAFTADDGALNAYGDELASAACGACHSQPAPGHYPANQWIGIIKDMKDSTTLDAEEVRFLQAYYQLRAKDMGGGHM